MARRRLGVGEYTTEAFASWRAQIAFLGTVARLAPEVLHTLRRDVLPVYVAGLDPARLRDPAAGGMYVMSWSTAPALLREALSAWGRSWYIAKRWVYEEALPKLDEWRRCPSMADAPCGWLNCGAMEQATLRTPALAFELPGWSPTREGRAEYKATAAAAFARELDRYLDGVEEEFKTGWSDFPPTPDKPSFAKHLEWLVHYQVRGERIARLAAAECVSTDSMRDALRSMAELCDLTLRPGRAGRPPN